MISSIFGKCLAGKRLIWTGAALLAAVAIPALGATTHHLHKSSLTHRTHSHALVHHKATVKSASHAKVKTASHAQRPGYPLALSAVTSMHSGHASATPTASLTKHNTSVKATTTSHKAKPLSSTAHPSAGRM